ncbi:unnamed protein product [Soboliphyme baturini]|uniref:ShKT domain-containing protein n=1 Tax=Soboliphyme baturini TaxID=241478 RepID=A0A183J134_9BILA|nr:unnamed protein product [Soboliphyme baturini]
MLLVGLALVCFAHVASCQPGPPNLFPNPPIFPHGPGPVIPSDSDPQTPQSDSGPGIGPQSQQCNTCPFYCNQCPSWDFSCLTNCYYPRSHSHLPCNLCPMYDWKCLRICTFCSVSGSGYPCGHHSVPCSQCYYWDYTCLRNCYIVNDAPAMPPNCCNNCPYWDVICLRSCVTCCKPGSYDCSNLTKK